MLKNCITSKKQGDIGLGSAIAYFTSQGYTVSIPLTDSQPYDLIVDINNELKKVQVKTVYCKKNNKKYQVNLRTMGGTRGDQVKKFDKTQVDYVYILTNDGDRYLIPSLEISGKSSINLGLEKEQYKV